MSTESDNPSSPFPSASSPSPPTSSSVSDTSSSSPSSSISPSSSTPSPSPSVSSSSPPSPPSPSITVEFSGGLEYLFNRRKRLTIPIPQTSPPSPFSLSSLILLLRDHYVSERPELFCSDGVNLRPGILCLVNESDWELVGTVEYEIQERDNIVFISTLHGG